MLKRKANDDEIKKLRGHRGWSQEELAAKADLSVRTIRNCENGDEVSTKTLSLLAMVFGVSASTLMQGGDEVATIQVIVNVTVSDVSMLNSLLTAFKTIHTLKGDVTPKGEDLGKKTVTVSLSNYDLAQLLEKSMKTKPHVELALLSPLRDDSDTESRDRLLEVLKRHFKGEFRFRSISTDSAVTDPAIHEFVYDGVSYWIWN